MNKNVIIGLLAIALVIFGVILWVNASNTEKNDSITANSLEVENTPIIPSVPAVSVKPGIPTVSTDANAVVSNTATVVTGKVTPNGAPTTYWFEYGKTTTFGARTASVGIGSGFITLPTPAYITGLKATTTYYFRVVAQNRYGTTEGTTYTFTTNNTPPPQGSIPTVSTNAASSITRVTATLNGTVDSNYPPTSYWFEYGETADLGNVVNFQSIGNTDTNKIAAGLTNLKPMTKYYFRLYAQNQYGTALGSMLSFVTQGPRDPSTPTATTNAATGITNTLATLNGHVTANGAIATYWFEYSGDSVLMRIIGSTTPTQLVGKDAVNAAISAKIENLSADTIYYYHVVVSNMYGTTRGDIVKFKTKPLNR